MLWPSPPSRLGIAWSDQRQPGEPFEVTYVERGSPAAIAGLRVGDRITAFASQPAERAEDLTDIVLAAPQQTTVIIERAGASGPLSLPLTLRGEPVRIGLTWSNDDAEPGVAIVTSVVPGSAAARAGIEPRDRLSLPVARAAEDGDWLRELSASDSEITLRRERRGRMREVTLRPLPILDSLKDHGENSAVE